MNCEETLFRQFSLPSMLSCLLASKIDMPSDRCVMWELAKDGQCCTALVSAKVYRVLTWFRFASCRAHSSYYAAGDA